MSESNSLQLSLAGQTFTIQPLTVGQLEELHVGVVTPEGSGPKEKMRSFYERNIEILAVALSSDHPNMTADTIRKMRIGTLQAMTGAVSDILDFSGISKKEDAKPEAATGEAQAAA